MWTACTEADQLSPGQPVGLPELEQRVLVTRVTRRPELTAIRDLRFAHAEAKMRGRVSGDFLPAEHRNKTAAELPPEPPPEAPEYDRNCLVEARRINLDDRVKGQHVGAHGWVSDARPLGDDWTPTHWTPSPESPLD